MNIDERITERYKKEADKELKEEVFDFLSELEHKGTQTINYEIYLITEFGFTLDQAKQWIKTWKKEGN